MCLPYLIETAILFLLVELLLISLLFCHIWPLKISCALTALLVMLLFNYSSINSFISVSLLSKSHFHRYITMHYSLKNPKLSCVHYGEIWIPKKNDLWFGSRTTRLEMGFHSQLWRRPLIEFYSGIYSILKGHFYLLHLTFCWVLREVH